MDKNRVWILYSTPIRHYATKVKKLFKRMDFPFYGKIFPYNINLATYFSPKDRGFFMNFITVQ